ncbi:MAG TPA: hypothetical protein VIR15_13760 [Intrasporangium sp.]|uniref:hypothetical protein n=1 Tax=Intrasporangium sp. TaxID=1925024 RepID=UPI002F933AD5
MSRIQFDIFAKDHNASSTFNKVGDSAQGVSGRIDDVSKRFDKHAAIVKSAAALAGTAIIAFGKSAIDAASDQNEVISKSSVIFGDQAKSIEKWAGSAARNMGLSKTEALGAASSFGDMFLQLGFAGDAASDMSKQVVQMSADLGSFNNLPTAEVVDMISAAFRGEYDSLQRVIPNINAARVQTEALATTGKKNATELTAQEKAAATLAIVMKDGARAQGDFARTSDGAANKAKITEARFADLQVTIGQKLLPVWDALLTTAQATITVVGGVVDAIGNIPGPVLAAVAGLTAFHLLKGPLGSMGGTVTGVLGAMRESFGYAAQAAERAGGGLKGFNAGLRTITGASGGLSLFKSGLSGITALLGGPWGIALMTATYLVGQWAQANADAKADADSLRESIDKQTGSWTDLSREAVASKIALEVPREVLDSLEQAGVNVKAIPDAILQGGPAWEALNSQLLQAQFGSAGLGAEADKLRTVMLSQRDAAAAARGEFDTTAKMTGQLGTATSTAGAAASSSAGSMVNLATEVDTVGGKAMTTMEAIKALATATLEATNAAMGADAANAELKESISAASKAAEENGRTVNKAKTALNLNTEAGRSNQAALQGLARDALSAAKANLENGASTDKVKRSTLGAREEFVKAAQKMGLSKDAAQKLATKYGLTADSVDDLHDSMDEIPSQVKSRITVEQGAAIARVESLKRALRMIPDERVNVFVNTVNRAARGVNYGVQERASGGRYEAGPLLVGEDGPELQFPDDGGYVMNAADTARLLANAKNRPTGGGGGTEAETIAPLHIQVEGETLVKVLLKIKRTRGGVELGIG